MKVTSYLLCAGALAVPLLFTACETPETRIQAKQSLFDSLKPGDQELIKKGKAGIGFTPEMVKLALGDPDRIRTRTDGTGSHEVWVYANYESTGGVYLYRGYYHRLCGPRLYPYYLSEESRRLIDSTRVQFSDGKVDAIEEEKNE